ncbi:MAG TPA: hypothetical protein VM818_14480 [Vicinamibacterales bacterium]|nr:hypothetical protein [Vicinamibacterales bacterium]
MAMILSSGIAVLGQSPIRGVYLLPVGSRASIVVELQNTGAQATVVETDDAGTFVVDIGPVVGTVAAQVLRATPLAPLVREVIVGGVSHSLDKTVVRVQVALRSAAAGSVRIADRRVYIDFAPQGARPQVTPPAPAPPPPAAPPAALVADRVETDEDVLARARSLASVPNVKGLIDLRARVVRQRRDTGQSPATDGKSDELLARIDAYLAEAQKLQLAKDARLFQQAQQAGQYRSALQQAVSDLDTIDTALRSGNVQTGTLSRIQIDSVQLATRLHAIEAPSDHWIAHAQVCDAADALAAALARVPADGKVSPDAPVRTAIGRARAALRTALDAAPQASPAR